jgi:hypothetical protein
MKTSYYFPKALFIFLITIATSTYSQTSVQDLPHFKKIVVSPYINLMLIKGEEEKIELTSTNVEIEKINIVVNRGILKIYLDGARLWPKNEKTRIGGKKYIQERYKDVSINATITYQELKALQINGEGKVQCSEKLENEKFKLSSIGESVVHLDLIHAEKLKIRSIGENKIRILTGNVENIKTKLIGENDVTINSGRVDNIKTRLIGENTVNLENVFIEFSKCSAIGENKLDCNSKEYLKVLLIGESEITQFGEAKIRKIGIGENDCKYAYNKN